MWPKENNGSESFETETEEKCLDSGLDGFNRHESPFDTSNKPVVRNKHQRLSPAGMFELCFVYKRNNSYIEYLQLRSRGIHR